MTAHKRGRSRPDLGPIGDIGPAQRRKHDSVRVEALRGEVRRARIETQTPLDRYRRRHEIDDRQWKAGDRLRGLYYLAGLEARVTATLDRIPGTGPAADLNTRLLDGHHALKATLDALGRALAPILVHVACQGHPAADWARARGWPEHQGLGALKIALDALAEHYRNSVPEMP